MYQVCTCSTHFGKDKNFIPNANCPIHGKQPEMAMTVTPCPDCNRLRAELAEKDKALQGATLHFRLLSELEEELSQVRKERDELSNNLHDTIEDLRDTLALERRALELACELGDRYNGMSGPDYFRKKAIKK